MVVVRHRGRTRVAAQLGIFRKLRLIEHGVGLQMVFQMSLAKFALRLRDCSGR
jgi:hypothetical protein